MIQKEITCKVAPNITFYAEGATPSRTSHHSSIGRGGVRPGDWKVANPTEEERKSEIPPQSVSGP